MHLVVGALFLSEDVARHHRITDDDEAAWPERQLEGRSVLVVIPSDKRMIGLGVFIVAVRDRILENDTTRPAVSSRPTNLGPKRLRHVLGKEQEERSACELLEVTGSDVIHELERPFARERLDRVPGRHRRAILRLVAFACGVSIVRRGPR